MTRKRFPYYWPFVRGIHWWILPTKYQQCVSVPWRHHVMGKWYEKTRNETVLQCFIQQNIEMVMAWIQCTQTHTHTHTNTYYPSCTGSRANVNYERIALLSWSLVRIHNLWISATSCATHSSGQRVNYPAMSHPSKTVWHQLNGIAHWPQQWADQSGKDSMLPGSLYLTLAYHLAYHFV